MPQDAYTLYYLAQELNNVFNGGKINRIVAPNVDQVIFTVYNGNGTAKLLIDVNPSSPRIGITDTEKPSPLTATNFCMLLRKHLLNAEIDNISIVGFDRIIKIELTSSNEFFDSEKKVLYVELMGRYSNVLLTQNGIVLGGNRGVNMFDDKVRPLIVGLKYNLPPDNGKILPNDEKLITLLTGFYGDNLSDFLIKNVQGIALSTAEKCVRDYFNIYGNEIKFDEEKAKSFFNFFNDFIFKSKKQPVVIIKNGKAVDVCLFKYNETDDAIAFNKLYKAEDFYYNEREKIKEFSEKKNRATGVINALIKKAEKRQSQILSREKEALSYQKMRLYGELLVSNYYRLKDGEKIVTVENYYDDNKPIDIPLDDKISVKQNAENYFKKYNKQKRTVILLEPQKQMVKNDISYFESLSLLVELAENSEDIDLVISELSDGGYLKKQSNSEKKKTDVRPYRQYLYDGFTVKVGRNNIENDKLTCSSRGDNLWIHAKDYHSSHIIIESNGKKVPDNVIITACEICAYYSKGREAGKVEVVVTEKKNVKKPPKSKLGFCTYSNFVSYTVKPDKHENLLEN